MVTRKGKEKVAAPNETDFSSNFSGNKPNCTKISQKFFVKNMDKKVATMVSVSLVVPKVPLKISRKRLGECLGLGFGGRV